MKRTDADEHSSNLFQDENLPTTAGTLLEKTWLNAVQEELANTIEYQFGALVPSDDYQMNDALQYALSDCLYSDSVSNLGSFHPRMDLALNTWVEQITGLRGELHAGPIWLESAGRVLRVMITDEKIVAAGLDDFTYTDATTTYIAVKISDGWTLETNTGTPTAGFENFLKVITAGGNITDSEALSPAWPEIYAQGIRIMDSPRNVFNAGGLEGLRVYGDGAGAAFYNDVIKFQFMKIGVNKALPLELRNDGSDDEARVTTRGRLLHLPHNESSPSVILDYRRLRTHAGTAEKQTQGFWERTAVGDRVGNGNTDMPIEEPINGQVLFYRWQIVAVQSGDASKTYSKSAQFSAYNDGSITKNLDFNTQVDDDTTGGITASSLLSGSTIYIRATVSDTNTYRFTVYWSIIDTDTTA